MPVPSTRVWAEHQVRLFLGHLGGLNRSPLTVMAYARDLAEFLTHLGEGTPAAVPDAEPAGRADALRNATSRYIAALRARKNAPRSIGRRIAALRSWSKFLVRTRALPADPFAMLETPRAPKRLPRVPHVADFAQFLGQIESLQERALFVVFGRCGLRISEARGLSVEDIERGPRQLRAFGKGSKERIVPFNDDSLATLEAHIAELPYSTGPLFPSRRNGQIQMPVRPMSVSALRQTVYRHTQKILGRRWHPHSLRHLFATDLYERDVDLQVIQELLGHASIATTTIYTHVSAGRKREAIERL